MPSLQWHISELARATTHSKKPEIAIKLNPQHASAYLAKSQALVAFLGDVAVLEKGKLTERLACNFAIDMADHFGLEFAP